jgi:hypothetical protein
LGANQNNSGHQRPELTRTQWADDAGLSERQRKTMLRIANVPALAPLRLHQLDQIVAELDHEAPHSLLLEREE